MAENVKRQKNRRPKKRVCTFCVDKVEHIDYQRQVTTAIKRARHIALLPYSAE